MPAKTPISHASCNGNHDHLRVSLITADRVGTEREEVVNRSDAEQPPCEEPHNPPKGIAEIKVLEASETDEGETKPDVGNANGILRTGRDANNLVRR